MSPLRPERDRQISALYSSGEAFGLDMPAIFVPITGIVFPAVFIVLVGRVITAAE